MIRYTTIEWGGCCGKPKATYSVPVTITPYELTLLIPDLSLEDAIELLATRVKPDPSCDVYVNQAISRQVKKECVFPAVGSSVTVNIPAGRYTSTLSQEDADRQAEEEFKRIAQTTANQLGTCTTPTCVGCNDFRVTRSIECGEFRRDTRCVNGQCVDTSQEYFVCTGNCDGNNCKKPCTICGPSCPTGSCAPGYNCVNGACKINCEDAGCSIDCPEGRVENPCEVCVNGKPQTKRCPAGQRCVNGQCVDIPCDPDCGERAIEPGPNDCIQRSIVQSCQGGRCIDTTETKTTNLVDGKVCGTNKVCKSGQCVNVEIPCIQLDGSCENNGLCCENRVCFNGVCKDQCGPGYIRQGNICVVDNRPNILVSQTVTSTPPPATAYVSNRIGTYGCASAILELTGNSFQPIPLVDGTTIGPIKSLVVSTSGSAGTTLTDRQCNSHQCLYIVNTMSQLTLQEAMIWHIDTNVNPTLRNLYVMLRPNQQFPACGGTISAGPFHRTCQLNAQQNVGDDFVVVLVKQSSTSPDIRLSSLPQLMTFQAVACGSGTTTVNAKFTLSSNSPNNISGYSPTPTSWQGFGFNGTNWQQFELTSNLLNSTTIEGRIISGTELQVRLPNGVPVIAGNNVNNTRLIGTLQVNATRTTTLP